MQSDHYKKLSEDFLYIIQYRYSYKSKFIGVLELEGFRIMLQN
jgi:hypothetical protein